MKKRLLLAIAAVLLSGPALAQHLPWYAKGKAYRANLAEKFKQWIPKGWLVEAAAEGDLNGDNRPDVVLVASDRANDRAVHIFPDDDAGHVPLHSKTFIFTMNEGGDHALFLQSASYVDGRVMTHRGMPEVSFEIDKGLLAIWVETPLPSWHVKRTFRLEGDRLRLIGLDQRLFLSEFGLNQDTRYNLLTGQCQETVTFNGDESKKSKILNALKLQEGSAHKRIPGNRKIYFGQDDETLECR